MRLPVLRSALALLLSALVLALLACVIDFRESAAMLRMLPATSLAPALVLTGLVYIAGGFRFASFVERVARVGPYDAIRLNFALALATHALGILSDTIRIRYLMRRYGMALSVSISASIADRLLSTWLLAWGLFLLLPFAPGTPLALGGFVLLLLGLTVGWLLAHAKFWPAWLRTPLSFFARSVMDRRLLGRQVALQSSIVLAVGAMLWLLARALGADLSLLTSIAFAPAALLATVVPFTYAGLGARETVFAIGLPLFAPVTPESAVALSLGLGGCFLIGSLPGVFTLFSILKAPLSPEG
mgnify:FL=1